MIKLKSLFRRGQGPSGSKSSSSSNQQSYRNARSSSQSAAEASAGLTNANGQTEEDNYTAAAATEDSAKFYQPTTGVVDQNNAETSSKAIIGVVDRGGDYVALSSPPQDNYKSKQLIAGGGAGGVQGTTSTLATKKCKQPKPIPHPNSTTTTTTNVMPAIAVAAASVASNNNYDRTENDNNINANAIANYNYKLMNSIASGADGSSNYILGTDQNLMEATNKMQELQSQLERLGRENILLESKISEIVPYQNEVGKLRNELIKMQSLQEKSNMEISKLKYENESLRNRLRDVVNSPLSDTEKHQIIQDSQRLHSSAPASIALPNATEHDGTPCVTPDWDKNSSSSEISVACLQDKIIQMEETHYSTNEELQATLQELADLQTQLTETQSENERLSEEKEVLFQSLCRQTEKLNESRTQLTTLQELLLRESTQVEVGACEREKKLLDLIKLSQDERETILVKQEELNSELNELRQSVECASNDNSRFRERICLLDSTVDAANAERKQIESELQQAKEDASQKSIEISRLTTLLDNARAKIEELEQDRSRGEKTDLSDLLDASRKEKDLLESRVASLQDQISRGQAEIRKLKDQLSGITEECKVAKNNAKCALSHLEYRYETLQQEKEKLSADYQQLQDSTAELQVQCKCHLEDKAQLQSLLTETQKHLGDAERKLNDKEEQLQKEIKLRKQEAEEWQQFQSDLLMTVRVANDFKTEALTAREQMVLDNKTQKEKIRLLEQEIEKLSKPHVSPTETTQPSLLSTVAVQQEMATRRTTKVGLSKQDSRLSVKTLIESIENNKQQAKTEESESRYSSSSSLNSATSDLNPNFNPASTNIPNEWTENVRIPVTAVTAAPVTALNPKGPLREQQQQQSLVSSMHFSSINSVSKSLVSGERKDPLNMLAKNGGSKRNALLKWCQNKTVGYRNIDITNFSSSWNDGLAFCAILHSYLPDRIPYDTLSPANKRRNFSLAFAAAESVGITTTLNINDMCQIERPDWTQVMTYVTAIYKHFET